MDNHSLQVNVTLICNYLLGNQIKSKGGLHLFY